MSCLHGGVTGIKILIYEQLSTGINICINICLLNISNQQNWYKYSRYSAEGSKRETETYKQQSEIVKRHLPSISVQGNVGGRQSIGTDENVTGRRKRFRPHKAYIYSRVRLSVCFYERCDPRN